MSDEDDSQNVVPLGQPIEPPPEPRRPGRLHGLAIAGMAVCALVGVISMLAFITVTWPNGTGRYVVGVFIGSGVGFMTCASLAVFSAARETYVKSDQPRQ